MLKIQTEGFTYFLENFMMVVAVLTLITIAIIVIEKLRR